MIDCLRIDFKLTIALEAQQILKKILQIALLTAVITLAYLLATLPAKPVKADANWSTLGADVQRSHGIAVDIAPPLKRKWVSQNFKPTAKGNNDIVLLAVDKERIYCLAIEDGLAYIMAMDADSGRTEWRLFCGNWGGPGAWPGLEPILVLAENRVFLQLVYIPYGESDGKGENRVLTIVMALDAATGRGLWQSGSARMETERNTNRVVSLGPIFASNNILFAYLPPPNTEGITAYRVNDGSKLWGPTGTPGGLPLVIGADYIEWYSDTEGIEVKFRRIKDGTLRDSRILSDPRGTVYPGSGSGSGNIVYNTLSWVDETIPLLCTDRGGILCFFNVKTNDYLPVIEGSALGRDGEVYALCRNLRRVIIPMQPGNVPGGDSIPAYASGKEKSPRLIAFEAHSWTEKWSIPEPLEPLVITGNVLWCCTDSRKGGLETDLVAVDRMQGKVIWRQHVEAYSQIIAGPKGLYLYVWNQKTTLAASARHLECWAPAGR